MFEATKTRKETTTMNNQGDKMKMRGGILRRSMLSSLPLFDEPAKQRSEREAIEAQNCGECLMEHVQVVKLEANGHCACCARAHVPVTETAFDYDLQVWIGADGVIPVCGHPSSMSSAARPCCNASIHAYGNSTIEAAREDFFGRQ
jgi:hypothetical protein